ncbi:metallophosphoesterase [Nakamurella flavida]|uniref:Metallophosphoesterase n=1 Tax=Nakamurella flavida TaxID=363630 RepID=A0A939C4X0_9ACTN|nr:metallophosphoesterase [Nakamurella flavida]MBM9476174.1 metallophosphoesterase [Nakamurella flavida]MDP9777081.1 putative MPP superfamily phosphohydrolase [Nakamurella flavida]
MGFLLGLGGLLLVGHVYLWFRLVRSTGTSRRWRVGGAVVLGVLFAVFLTAVSTQRSAAFSQITLLHGVGNVWLAMVLYLFLALLVGELVRLVVLVVRRSRARSSHDGAPVDPRRRLLVSRGIAVGAGVAATATVGWGMTQALSTDVRVLRQGVPLTRLPAGLDGYRIAVVTDLHLGALNGRAFTERVVAAVNAEQVDAVALVGDLVDGSVAALSDSVAPLAGLTSVDGTFFTTGNHEYYSGAGEWMRHLPTLGITVLHNSSVGVSRGGDSLRIAGINDWTGEENGDPANLQTALADRADGEPVVLMAHQPRQVGAAAAADVDLQLAGHTHGGQIWPFHYAVLAQQKVLWGLSRHDNTWLYTSRGIGFWGPPVRVGAPPDITVLTLTRP